MIYKDIKTKYTLEYIDNEKDFNHLDDWDYLRIWNMEPWELYKKKEFDNIGQAMVVFNHYIMDESILDVKLFEEVTFEVDGREETIERFIEMPNTFQYSMRECIDKHYNDRIRQLERQIESMQQTMETTKQFLELPYVKKAYEDFIKEHGTYGE